MIDLHCHVLPALDDGPADLEASLALAQAAAEDGVRVLAATPHLRDDYPGVRPNELGGHCVDLQAELDGCAIPIQLVPAAEVDLGWALWALPEDLKRATYGGRGSDVLLETPYGPLPPGFEERIFETFAPLNIRVLLAHPERSATFQDDPRRLSDLVNQGVLVQVTSGALARGGRRSRSGRLARAMVREGVAHVIATDGHGLLRPAKLSDGVAAAARIDRRRAHWMVSEGPAAILSGEPLTPPPRASRSFSWLR